MTNAALKKAVDFSGGQRALASKCNATQQHVWNWMQSGKVPVDRAILIEIATGGEVTKEELAPEFFASLPKITIAKSRSKK